MGNNSSLEKNVMEETSDEIKETKEDDLYEIVSKKELDKSKYQNDLNKNEIYQLQAEIDKKDDCLNSKIFEVTKLELMNKELEDESKVLENVIKMDNHKYNQLKGKFYDLEYEKLDVEEKYLTMSDYKDAYITLKEQYTELEMKYSSVVAEKNDYKNQTDILNNKMKELCKYKNKFFNLEESNSLLKTNLHSIKRDNQLLKDRMNKNLNYYIKIFDNDVFRKKIYDYIDCLKIEPYVNYTIIDNILNIFKNEILANQYIN